MSGIGRVTAIRFAEAGADLYLVDINLEGLKAVEGELQKFGVNVKTFKADLSKKEEIDALWENMEDRLPDILVNNAAIYPFKEFLDVDRAFLEKIMNINLQSVFWMCQHLIRRCIASGRKCVIINVGSIEAVMPFAENLVHYSITKAGVIALTRSLAREFGKYGIRVNAVIPGGIVTPGVQKVAKELGEKALTAGQEYLKRVPLRRMGDPDEVARVILFLASDMSSYITGAAVPVDGGFLSA